VGSRLYWFRREKCPRVSASCPTLVTGQADDAYRPA
jgi:hypothetical protein